MQIQSPLSNLRQVLSEVKTTANLYKPTLQANESATRAALIDPVLKALGWDIANPNMVEVEKTAPGTRADYALYDYDKNVKVVIEAKKLGVNLGQLALGLVNDTFGFKTSSVFLTDGIVWHHYTKFDPTSFVADKVFDLSGKDLDEVTAYLVQELDAANFWPEHPDINVLEQEVTQLRSDLSSLQQKVDLLSQGQLVPPPPPLPRKWNELSSIANPMNTQPSLLRLPDDTEITVKTWRGVLVEICKFVLARNSQIPVPFKDDANLTVDLIRNIKPLRDSSFVTEIYNGQTVYLFANYSAENCRRNALYILKQLPKAQQPVTAAVLYAPTP